MVMPEIEDKEPFQQEGPRDLTWEDVVATYEKMGLKSLPEVATHVLISGEWVPYYARD